MHRHPPRTRIQLSLPKAVAVVIATLAVCVGVAALGVVTLGLLVNLFRWVTGL